MEHYEIILYWSKEDSVYVAEVPELPGCIAHGDSHEAALSKVKEAMVLWLEVARDRGLQVPAPKGGRLMYA